MMSEEYAEVMTDPDVIEYNILSQKLYDFIKNITN